MYLKETLDFDFIIRMKKSLWIKNHSGEQRQSKDWVPSNRRSRTLRNAYITKDDYTVATISPGAINDLLKNLGRVCHFDFVLDLSRHSCRSLDLI